jgi:hypothetical protein
MFNHFNGANLQDKWLISFLKFVSKCHPKVLDSNEKANIKIMWKGWHKCNSYNKGDN